MTKPDSKDPYCGEETFQDIELCTYTYRYIDMSTGETAPAPVCTKSVGCLYKRRIPLSELSKIKPETV